MKKLALITPLILFIGLYSCKEETPKRIIASTELTTYGEHEIFEDDFENGKEDFWKSHMADEARSEVVDDPLNPDNKALSITLTLDDYDRGGRRTEHVVVSKDSFGYLNKHGFKFMLPESFFAEEEKSGWYIINQWHDHPPIGFNWSTRQHKTRPPIALTITHTPEDGFKLIYKYGLDTGDLNEVASLEWPEKLEPNTWYEFDNEVFWSLYSSDGYSLPKLNGVPFVKEDDPENGIEDNKVYRRNMYNTRCNYFKFGLYRSGGQTHDRYILLDDFYMETVRVAYPMVR